jgi:endonuclease/exonuclease/phosphatase family metal-dependent hydrolase
VVIACLATASAPSSADEPPARLRVLAYNVQFLPGLAKLFNARGNDDYRPHALARVLADFDIVGLNEVFDQGPRKLILDDLHQQWGDRFHVAECPEPGPNVGRFNAGLAIVSRYPITQSHHVAFSVASTKKEFGVFADEFAAKGVLHARIAISNASRPITVDVFTTHLDSKLASVREVQAKEMAGFIEKHADPAHAVLLLGDFNTRGNPSEVEKPDSRYHTLLNHLRSGRANLVDAWLEVGQGDGGTGEQTGPSGGNRIDYVFFAPPVSDRGPLRLREARVHRFPDPKVTALSDHSAVEALFDIAP